MATATDPKMTDKMTLYLNIPFLPKVQRLDLLQCHFCDQQTSVKSHEHYTLQLENHQFIACHKCGELIIRERKRKLRQANDNSTLY